MSDAPTPAYSADNGDDVQAAARATMPDFYVAALLSPRAQRGDLIACAAFCGEIARIWHSVSEPHLGEIRIQWWRDALAAAARGEKSGHAVADAFQAVAVRRQIDPAVIDTFFDAYADALYSAPPDDDAAFLRRIDAMFAAPFYFALACLTNDREIYSSQITAAGRTYGIMRTAVTLPYALAHDRMPFPSDYGTAGETRVGDDDSGWRTITSAAVAASRSALRDFSQFQRGLAKPVRAAFLPVAVVEPYLAALQHHEHRPDRDVAEIAPLQRPWRMLKAHLTGSISASTST